MTFSSMFMFDRFEISGKPHIDVFSSFTICNNNILSLYSLIYTIMKISSHTQNPLLFINTLYFTIYGAMIMLLHDFHENAFDP